MLTGVYPREGRAWVDYRSRRVLIKGTSVSVATFSFDNQNIVGYIPNKKFSCFI